MLIAMLTIKCFLDENRVFYMNKVTTLLFVNVFEITECLWIFKMDGKRNFIIPYLYYLYAYSSRKRVSEQR